MGLKTDEKLVGKLVTAFTETVVSELQEVQAITGGTTKNGKNGNSWDVRFNKIETAALNEGCKALRVQLSAIWSFVAVLVEETGELFLFFKKANCDNLLKQWHHSPYHYLKCFLSKNIHLEAESSDQILLFNAFPDNRYDEKRVKKAKMILQNDFDAVKQVVILSLEEYKGVAIDVQARLITDQGFTSENISLAAYIASDYTESGALNNSPAEKPIVRVKQSVKDEQRKKKKGNPITDLKTNKDKDEEGNSLV
ncbi:DUF5986 family protein [Listeria booriae]|uniref:Uncharacterized protein n=1 Tax=Listeria booriae TaxID=1552123 RepID=A0A7X0XQW8_9LIST|nr:DUF5986 family protein [Listeria booriae]MBC1778929.1 hypothetical protein [Listeria booriae]